MAEAVDAYRREILDLVRARGEGTDPETVFGEMAGSLLEEVDEISDFVASRHRGIGSRRRAIGVDGYSFDDTDGSARLVISDYDGGPDIQTRTRTAAEADFSRRTAFLEDALHGNLSE